MDLPSSKICQQIITLHNGLGQSNGADCLDPLLKLLDENALSWSDLPEFFHERGLRSSSSSKRVRRTVCGMHALVGRASTPSQRLNARNKLIKRLAEESLDWANDLPGILGAEWADSTTSSSPAPPSDPRDAAFHPFDNPEFTPASLVEAVTKRYVTMRPHLHVLYVLWLCFTHVYKKFVIAPRMHLTSEDPGAGKSVALEVARRLALRPNPETFSTGAAIMDFIDEGPCSVFLDEGDHLDAEAKKKFQLLWNDGHKRGARRSLMIKGKRTLVDLHAPMALASIGDAFLGPTEKSRTYKLPMEPYDGVNIPQPERRFDDETAEDLDQVYTYLRHWAGNVKLNLDPPMPPGMLGRFADNVRGLLAVADDCGAEWGRRAREAIMVMFEAEKVAKPQYIIVRHGIVIFEALGIELIGSVRFNVELKRLDLPDAR